MGKDKLDRLPCAGDIYGPGIPSRNQRRYFQRPRDRGPYRFRICYMSIAVTPCNVGGLSQRGGSVSLRADLTRPLAAEIGRALFEKGLRPFLRLLGVVIERQGLEAEGADALDVLAAPRWKR